MPRPKPSSVSGGIKTTRRPFFRKQRKNNEKEEIASIDSWIDAMKPSAGTNPLSIPPPPPSAPVGKLPGGAGFSPYAGCKLFSQLPISLKTKDGLKMKYTEMSEIQRASLPHSICGRDILGAAKTGSGKTLAFIIPVIEKLYRLRWGTEDGVGAIIISPTKDLAVQLFEELKKVGKFHTLSAGLLVGGRDVNSEKQRVNSLNIIICTPGRLLQHMDETPNFDCSNLQILVLDEADRILDKGFREQVDAILNSLPTNRQTLLFSATQTKSVKDLARVSLNEPEYISVHAESVTATPERLKQLAVVIPLEEKLDVLWSFIRRHLKSKILVFLSTCKQVRFVFEVFSKLRPGIPIKHLHGGMSPTKRMLTCNSFAESTSVLFSTDVASRGLDFPSVDWVIQVDCPEDMATYIHRVGRTARFTSEGKSVLFLSPSEEKMLDKLQGADAKIPIKRINPNKQRLEQISHRLSSVLVQYPDLQYLAKRAFITYLRSIEKNRDKEVFDVTKLPLEEFAKSLGLAVTPKVRFIKRKGKNGSLMVHEDDDVEVAKKTDTNVGTTGTGLGEDLDDDFLVPKETSSEPAKDIVEDELPTRLLKRKRLKINPHRPTSNKIKFDDECNALPPLATIADLQSADNPLDQTKVEERFVKLRAEMNIQDKEDKLVQKQKKREKREKQKMKIRKWREEEQEEEESESDVDEREASGRKSKVYFDSDNEEEEKDKKSVNEDKISLAEQEALALKLLSGMHS